MPRDPASGLTVADHLLRALLAEGVRHVFRYPGGAALPVYGALSRQAVRARAKTAADRMLLG
jgi:thiamine pyrophosphate-dependent acetolactate synthase large subunit-like protein